MMSLFVSPVEPVLFSNADTMYNVTIPGRTNDTSHINKTPQCNYLQLTAVKNM